MMAIAIALTVTSLAGVVQAGFHLELRTGWRLQSSREIRVSPEQLSSSDFSPTGWCRTDVPATVLAALVSGGKFEDLFYSDNILKVPGMRELLNAKDNPFGCSWWYRVQFQVPANFKGRKVWLHLNGINAKANVWINGRQVADSNAIAGAYRMFELDVSPYLSFDRPDVLAIEVFPPSADDFGINFVDWMPTPPDRSMGLWRGVSLTASGPVRVRYPEVVTHFSDDSLRCADLTVKTELDNDTSSPVKGTVHAEFDGISVAKEVVLAPMEKRLVDLDPSEFPALRIRNPAIWWPTGLGEHPLHKLNVTFEVSGIVSDSCTTDFGIREIAGKLYGDAAKSGEVFDNNDGFHNIKTDERPLLIYVNRRPVLIRVLHGIVWVGGSDRWGSRSSLPQKNRMRTR